jgi:hypothetical protein
MVKSINEPNKQVKMKMLEFFIKTSVPRIIKEEFQKIDIDDVRK